MVKYRNEAKGPRIVMMRGGGDVWFQPGEEKVIDGSRARGIPSGLVEIPMVELGRGSIAHDDDLPPAPAGLAADLQQLDHDGDGKAGGSLPHDPPALSGMSKAELLAQAQAEGVAANQAMNKAAIIAAIQAARGAA